MPYPYPLILFFFFFLRLSTLQRQDIEVINFQIQCFARLDKSEPKRRTKNEKKNPCHGDWVEKRQWIILKCIDEKFLETKDMNGSRLEYWIVNVGYVCFRILFFFFSFFFTFCLLLRRRSFRITLIPSRIIHIISDWAKSRKRDCYLCFALFVLLCLWADTFTFAA